MKLLRAQPSLALDQLTLPATKREVSERVAPAFARKPSLTVLRMPLHVVVNVVVHRLVVSQESSFREERQLWGGSQQHSPPGASVRLHKYPTQPTQESQTHPRMASASPSATIMFQPPLLNRTLASHGRRLSKRRMIAPAGGSSLDAQAAEEQPSSTGGARTKVAHQTSKDEEATEDEYDAATGMAAPAVADCSLSSHGSAMNVESLSDSAEKRLSALAGSKRPSLLVPESLRKYSTLDVVPAPRAIGPREE